MFGSAADCTREAMLAVSPKTSESLPPPLPEARDLIAPLYASFTEGFDTVDLKDAKALARRAEQLTTYALSQVQKRNPD